MDTPRIVEHIWCSGLSTSLGRRQLETLVAFSEDVRGARITSLIEDEIGVANGSTNSMLQAFDEVVLRALIEGQVPITDLGDDARKFCANAGLSPAITTSCNHLHRLPDLAAALDARRGARLQGKRNMVALRRPHIRARAIMSGHTATFAPYFLAATQGAVKDTRFVAGATSPVRSPVNYVADVVLVSQRSWCIVDLLGYDNRDLRTHPFVERRALAAQLVHELGEPTIRLIEEAPHAGADSHDLLFAEADAPWRPLWMVVE